MALRTKIVLLIAAVAMIVCSVSAPAQPTANQDSRHNVLILNSYHKEFQWTDNQVAGAREVLTADLDNLELYVEYMDTKRIYTEEYLAKLVNVYHLKYDNVRLDAIITTDDNALHFVMDHHHDLFQDSPVSFCGINDYSSFSFAGKEQFTGLVEVLDIKATIDLALELHPKTSKVYVVVDSTPTGIGQLADVASAAGQYEQLQFEYIKGLDYSTAEMLEQLEQLPKDSIVLLTVWARDKNDDYAPTDQVAPLISSRANAPVYGITDMYLGHGIVGGKLLNSETHGRLAAERIVRILGGEKPSNIPPLIESQNPYMFDEVQLHRWNIDHADLPKGSIVINRAFSLYQTYRTQIWSIAAVFGVLLIVVASLIANIIKRKQAEEKLKDSEKRSWAYLEYSPACTKIVDLDFNLQYMSRAGVVGLNIDDITEFYGKPYPLEFYPESFKKPMTKNLEKVKKTGIIITQEAPVVDIDGNELWFHSTLVPVNDDEGQIDYIMVVSIDITERKRAEQQREKLFITVEAQNQQLTASEQQLRASSQQTNALNQQLIASQQELSLKNEELQSIVYISSHDLKSPLVNINGFSAMLIEHCGEMKELLKKCDAASDTKKEITSLLNDDIPTDLDYISTSTKRMQRLIEGLLQVSRIGTVEIKTQNIDMNNIVAEIIDNVKYKTQDLDAEIVFENLPDCTGDKDQITQVFTNLIDNALKYLSHKRKGIVNITGKTKNKENIYCIEDNGIGINPAYHGKVFEIYHRLNPRASTEGDGLGLTIVRRILDRHKGRIWLESKPEKGSKFFIALPTK